MNILLFLISIIFSYIFFIFYKLSIGESDFLLGKQKIYHNFIDSLSGNLLIESSIFLLIAIFFLIYFSIITKKDTYDNMEIVKVFFKNNFKNIIYSIAFILFYISIYFIFSDLNLSFSYIIFIVNLIILLLFSVNKNFIILVDLLKINTIIFSLIYIFLFIQSFFAKQQIFFLIDFINSVLILSSFYLSFYSDKIIVKTKKINSILVFNFFLYLYLVLIFYTRFFYDKVIFLFSIYALFLCIIIFYGLLKIKLIKANFVDLKIIGIFFSYFSIIFGIYYLIFINLNLILLIILAYLSYFNFDIHKRYGNYFSLLFSLISFYFVIFYIYYRLFGNFLDIFFIFIINFGIVLFSYFYKFKLIYDYYFVYLSGIILNIITSFYYFYKNDFSFFNFGLILFYFSIYIFLCYYKIRKIDERKINSII